MQQPLNGAYSYASGKAHTDQTQYNQSKQGPGKCYYYYCYYYTTTLVHYCTTPPTIIAFYHYCYYYYYCCCWYSGAAATTLSLCPFVDSLCLAGTAMHNSPPQWSHDIEYTPNRPLPHSPPPPSCTTPEYLIKVNSKHASNTPPTPPLYNALSPDYGEPQTPLIHASHSFTAHTPSPKTVE